MNKNFSGKLLWVLGFTLILTFCAAGAALGVGAVMEMDVAPFVENDITYDAVRPIAETFGIYVDWNQDEQKVALSRGAYQLMMTVGATELTRITPEGEDTLSVDTPPVLKDNRVFLPTRLWAELFGLQVEWRPEDGSVTVSEGGKAVRLVPGSKGLSLSGGHFLTLYSQDESLSFYYPQSGVVDVVWEGYAEILLAVDDVDYIIVAVNAGAGRSDPVNYTMEEFDRLIYANASAAHGNVRRLPETYFGSPAYRIAGKAEDIPQAGVVFLKNGYLCGLTVEAKKDFGPDAFQQGMLDIVSEDADRESRSDTPVEIDESALEAELAVVNALLDEIIASFVAK